MAPKAETSAEKDRYDRRDPLSLTVPRLPVTRETYVDFVRPWAGPHEITPEADAWNWRHGPLGLMPLLAVFAFDGDPKLGAFIRAGQRRFAEWVKESIAKKGVVFCLDALTFCTLCAQELRKHELMGPDDEQWVREMFLEVRERHAAWAEDGPWDGWFRGSQHRAQAQGINNALAAFLYPEEPGASEWRRIAEDIWGDWWNFRDVGINDMWYFHSALGNITRAAHILGRHEVFTDPQSRQVFERILIETTPEGGVVPYGASCGYNVVAGSRIVSLELAARHTGDGRYRWAAHRILNCCQARGSYRASVHAAKGIADIAVASLICDDSIEPVTPEPGSKLLTRKEITRGGVRFPGYAGVDCEMYMTQKVMPNKLVFRSGWEPGDLYMLAECYVRHAPLNPTAILGLERYGSSMAEMASEKFISRENTVHIRDASGTATYLGARGRQPSAELPLDWVGMESAVPEFSDHASATHALVTVTEYMGFRATQQREFLFIKNGFVLVRDETTFDDAFRAEVGPTWNTQHVGEVRGANWINTWFSAHYYENQKLFDVPPWDLLVWYAPRKDARLRVLPDQADQAQAGSHLFPTSYSCEGDVRPGTKVHFVTVLLPHAPTRDALQLASGIRVLTDKPGVAAVLIAWEDRWELALLNPEGCSLELEAGPAGSVRTDARAAYVDFVGTRLQRAFVHQGTCLEAGARTIIRRSERTDQEV